MSQRSSRRENGSWHQSFDVEMTVDDSASMPENGTHPMMNGNNNGTNGTMKRSSSLQSLNIFRRFPGKKGSLSKVFGRKSKHKISSAHSSTISRSQDNVAYDFEIQGGPPSPPSVSAMALGSDRSTQGPAFWEIPRERLVVGNSKQYGRFGEVYFGKVFIGNQSLAVDVKKQRDNTPLDKKKMLAELSVLSRVGRHANVLNLIGACSKSSGPVYLAYESMEPVRLDVYLRTIQDTHKPVTMHVPDFNITTPLMPLLMKFAVDIASGLSHLASKKIVEHSLGVRNIALTVDLVAKVTDFTIRDDTQSNGRAVNGNVQSSFPPTARWMAYETLVFSTCTEQSNVWSLGVIIWEIMSFGREPFDGYHVDELSKKLTEGYTLNQPDGCLDDVYEIIQSCLRLEPKERPMLKSLVARLARRYQSIKLQDKATRAEVFQSLAQLSDNHDNMTPPQIRSMEMLVNGNIDKEIPQARLMAVQYAATAFPGSHHASKYILLSACGDEVEVVRSEAINIIKMQARIAEMDMESDTPTGKMLPAFPQMINHIRMKAFDNLPNSSQKSQGPLGVFTIPFKALVYEKIAVYLRMCLAYSAGVSPNVFKTSEMKSQSPAISRYVNDLLDMYAGDSGAPISSYTGLLRQYVSAIGGGRGLYSLLEVVAMAPDKLAQQFVKKTDSLKMLLHSDEEAVRLYAAQLLGVVLCYAPPPLVVDSITSLTSRLDTDSMESCQAMLWTLGFSIGRQMQKETLANKDTFTRLTDTHNLGENIYRRATEAIVSKLNSSSPTIVKAACTAIAEIGRNGPIPLPKGGKTNGRSTKGSSESVRSKNGANGPTKLSLVQRLSDLFTKDSVLYVLELKKEAASALAHLMVGEAEFPYTKLALEALPNGLKISAPSREQLFTFQFHLADALSTALQGTSAPAALDPWLEESTTPLGSATPNNGDLKTLLDTLLTDRQKTNNSAITVMLTVLFETFRHHQSVKDNESEMMAIIKDAVMEWDANGVISDLPCDLQKRILQVLKLTRTLSDDGSFPPPSRMDSSDASTSSPASRMDSDEPLYAVVHRVTPDIHSSSANSSEDTAHDVTPMLDDAASEEEDATNEEDEVTSF
ncbi:uncharacterized protein LOC129272132 isoform X2 [Lytechinus pictus]|uniref:uncharacterized protein LOC129272132 isoform X2 n=1 Tax=Lytechinus pictus TaxID=7653 RepID=UPI0030B9BF7C